LRVLALDHGTVRIGAAICDPTGTLCTPLAVIEPPTADAVDLSGEEGSQAALARAFAEELGELLTIGVDTYDERLTSRMADATMRAGAKGASRDSIAAAHLLEAYLMSLARKGGDS
jgi:putative holliday junction resolvase